MLSKIAVAISTWIPKVDTAANAITVIVIAAPPMLIVAPKGMEIEYVSGVIPKRFAKSIFTGILAAELRVKNAVTPDSRKQRNTSGYGLRFITIATMIGLIINATANMQPRRTNNNLPYVRRAPKPFSPMDCATKPRIPSGANLMIHCTEVVIASEMEAITSFVSVDALRKAAPNIKAHPKIPM